jgi:serine/threonine protein kinase
MLSVGQLVGNYRIVREIGSGGMGVVFEALHPDIGRRAAVKVLHPELSRNPDVAARFLNEARAVNLVRHPGLVQIFEYGRLPDGTLYIVMDFLEGEPLAQRLARGPLPLGEALLIVKQLASALTAAHERGIIHRDLKPDNVMLVADPEGYRDTRPSLSAVRLLDFGIAKLIEGGQGLGGPRTPSGTRTGVVMGTPEYMAPEQCMGTSTIDGKVDVYALGIIFYEMLAGRRPFEAESTLELLNQHVHAMPPPLCHRGDNLPVEPRAAELSERMLAKNPDERPTMAEVAAEAMRLSARLGREPAEGPRSTTPATPTPTTPQHEVEGRLAIEQSITAQSSGAPFPFIAGPPVRDPRLFFGRERELRRLGSLWRQLPLQNAAIIGPRRSGKTSLLLFLRALTGKNPSLREGQRGDYLPAGRGLSFVFVDFQDPRLGTREGLLRHLLRGLRLPMPNHERCDLDGFMNRVSDALRTPTVILFDEIGVAIERYRELDTAFWEGLRALSSNQVEGNLAFVLAAHKPPHELAQSTSDPGGSPFFNIFGYTTTLGPLSEGEARELVNSAPLPFSESDIEWILAHSGRWPMLLQILCRERLLLLQERDSSSAWQEEGLRQIAPFTAGLK